MDVGYSGVERGGMRSLLSLGVAFIVVVKS